MSFQSYLQALYLREVGSLGSGGLSNMLVARWPNAAVGIKCTAGATPAFGAWTQIVAAAKIANPAWISKIFLDNPDNAGAVETWLVDLGAGAGGVEVSLSSGTNTAQGTDSVTQAWLSSVGSWVIPPLVLPTLLKVSGAPRIAAAVAGLVTGAKNVFVSFQTVSGIGT